MIYNEKTGFFEDSNDKILTFLGHEITGLASDFELILLAKGFVKEYGMFRGKFAGLDNCIVNLIRSKEFGCITGVSVMLRKTLHKKELDEYYSLFVQRLSVKYGKPIVSGDDMMYSLDNGDIKLMRFQKADGNEKQKWFLYLKYIVHPNLYQTQYREKLIKAIDMDI